MTFKPTPKPKPNSSRTKPLSEAHIQASCTEFLALDGWRCVRTDMPHLRGLGVSEPGMADNLYIRYHDTRAGMTSGRIWTTAECRTGCESAWIEWKRKGGKAGQHQKEWHAKERARGALTLIAGEDFEASIEGFCLHYQASGLQRRSIRIPR